MTQTRTSIEGADLLDLAVAYLRDDLRPTLEGRHRFLTLVAANALDIVTRELRLGPSAAHREAGRLRSLLAETGDRDALNRALCDALADGRFDESTPGLLDHLFATTMDRLAIDQPRYAAYRRELEATSPAD